VRETKIQDASFYAHSLAWTPKGSANATTSVVFDRNAAFPASKILSFERGHIEGKELALELVGLGRAIIGGIPNADEKKTQVIKVRASLDHSGLFIVDHAEVVTEWSEQVTEGEETKTVHKKTRSDLTITTEFLPALSIMTQKQIDDATLVEGQLVSQDKLIQETHDRRNALEAYIYAMRSNISERLAGYADDATKQKLSTMLDEQEAWLYTEEGETSNKQTYVDRLSKLQAIGGPIEKRHQEELERPSFVSTLQKTIASLRDKAATFDGIGAEEDKAAIEKKCAEVESWLAQGLQKQATLAKTQNPAITCQEISERTNRLMNDAKPLINKVRAKPEDKKKEDGDVKMEDATPEEVAKDANAEEIEIGGADSGANADKMDLD
jgi:heat shock protein 4